MVFGARRIVTYVDDAGRARMLPGQEATRAVDYVETPGMRTSILWSTAGVPAIGGEPADPVVGLRSVHPSAGGSTFLVLTLPPDSVYGAADFDPVAAGAEQLRVVPGIAERMEPDAPGFHRTDTVDYVVVLAGEVWLVVDDEEVCLRVGDTVVQGGARHAWQNRSEQAATLAVVLLGAK
ncbi:MAG: cupin domain-containing protein [Pseudomonadota bacterium]